MSHDSLMRVQTEAEMAWLERYPHVPIDRKLWGSDFHSRENEFIAGYLAGVAARTPKPKRRAARALSPEHEATAAILSDHHDTRTGG